MQSLDALPHNCDNLVESGSSICAKTTLLECSLKMRLPSFCSNMLGSTQMSVASTVCMSMTFMHHLVSIAVFTSTALAQHHLFFVICQATGNGASTAAANLRHRIRLQMYSVFYNCTFYIVCNFSSMMAISLLSSRHPIAPTCSCT